MRESIVLQLGGYANHVGSHFWNMQTSAAANNDGNSEEVFEGHRLFKRSKDAQSGYVPRVIMGDLPERTGHMLIAGQSTVATEQKARAGGHGDGDHDGDEMLLWDGSLSRIQQESYPMHPFQIYQQTSAQMLLGSIDPTSSEHDFFLERARGISGVEGYGDRPDEQSIRTWCDYMSTPIHSRSYLDLPLQYNSRNFDSFAAGLLHDTSATTRVVDEWSESFRYFAEECDTLTSVHVFADIHDGFSVLTREIVQEVRDDYRGVAMPVWAFTDSHLGGSKAGRGGGRGQDQEAGNMKEALQALSFSYCAASLLEHGASAIVAISPQEAARVVQAVYSAAATGGSGASSIMEADDASSETKLSSPLRPSMMTSTTPTTSAYLSSSVVAAAIDGITSPDLHRDAAEVNLAYINSGTDGSGRDCKASSSAGTVNSNNSNGSMSDLLFNATNAGRFPVLNMELALPLSPSPSALMRRIDSSFQLASQGRDAQDNLSINPFLSSIATAAKHTRVIRYKADMKRRKKGFGALPASFADPSDDDNDDDDNGTGTDWLASGIDMEMANSSHRPHTLTNVLSVRGDLSKAQFALDRYLWTKTDSNDSNERRNHLSRGGSTANARSYFLTRCIQRQTPLYLPLSTPMRITRAMRADSSFSTGSPSAQMKANTISALGADSTVPTLLAAHAAKWRQMRSHGALLSQLNKANIAEEDVQELSETLLRVASGYRDDLMG